MRSNLKGIHNFTEHPGSDLFSHYPNFAKSISSFQVVQLLKQASPLQCQTSNLCDLIILSLLIFFKSYTFIFSYNTDIELLRFVEHLEQVFNF